MVVQRRVGVLNPIINLQTAKRIVPYGTISFFGFLQTTPPYEILTFRVKMCCFQRSRRLAQLPARATHFRTRFDCAVVLTTHMRHIGRYDSSPDENI